MWAESFFTSELLTNIVANSRNPKCPDELFFGTTPTIYKHLIQHGQKNWVTKRDKIKTTKLQPKAVKCTMIGYARDHAGDTFCMYNPVTKHVTLSCDIKWDDWNTPVPPPCSMQETFGIDEEFLDDLELDEVVEVHAPNATTVTTTQPQIRSVASLPNISKAGRTKNRPPFTYTLNTAICDLT